MFVWWSDFGVERRIRIGSWENKCILEVFVFEIAGFYNFGFFRKTAEILSEKKKKKFIVHICKIIANKPIKVASSDSGFHPNGNRVEGVTGWLGARPSFLREQGVQL